MPNELHPGLASKTRPQYAGEPVSPFYQPSWGSLFDPIVDRAQAQAAESQQDYQEALRPQQMRELSRFRSLLRRMQDNRMNRLLRFAQRRGEVPTEIQATVRPG